MLGNIYQANQNEFLVQSIYRILHISNFLRLLHQLAGSTTLH